LPEIGSPPGKKAEAIRRANNESTLFKLDSPFSPSKMSLKTGQGSQDYVSIRSGGASNRDTMITSGSRKVQDGGNFKIIS
jgi:hypothetical protein